MFAYFFCEISLFAVLDEQEAGEKKEYSDSGSGKSTSIKCMQKSHICHYFITLSGKRIMVQNEVRKHDRHEIMESLMCLLSNLDLRFS